MLERGRTAWPALTVDADRFVAAIAPAVRGASDGDAALAALAADDLYLAQASCALGRCPRRCPRSRRCATRSPMASLAQMGLAPDAIDEVMQLVRSKLFAPPPRIATYSGRASLRSWVRTVATRIAVDRARSQTPATSEPEEVPERLPRSASRSSARALPREVSRGAQGRVRGRTRDARRPPAQPPAPSLRRRPHRRGDRRALRRPQDHRISLARSRADRAVETDARRLPASRQGVAVRAPEHLARVAESHRSQPQPGAGRLSDERDAALLQALCIDETNLTLFAENRLTEPARVAIEAHIDTCPTCRTLVGQLAGDIHGSGPIVATRIGRYLVSSELGAGGMGRVYLAHDPELDRRVAIKVLRHVDATGERDERMRREAQALARVAHPNVAAIYDVGELDDHLFLAMEYVPGGTLSAWLAKAPRSTREIVRVFEGAARGLAAVHERGLVHRDFKPDNVLLDERGLATVTDFGLVAMAEDRSGGLADEAAVGSLTATGAVLGTPAYMAPEQLAGGVVDARSDQFGFCVALYEALHGERPFQGTTIAEIKRAYEMPPKRGALPRWLHRVIARGLSIDPAARYASMDQLASALSRSATQRRIIAGVTAGVVLAGATIAFAATRSHAASCTGSTDLDAVWNSGRAPPDRASVREHARTVCRGYRRARSPVLSIATPSTGGSPTPRSARRRASTAPSSVETMDRRTSCLASREHELATLVDVLDHATPAVAEHALDLALAAVLPPLSRCVMTRPRARVEIRCCAACAVSPTRPASAPKRLPSMDLGQFADAERQDRAARSVRRHAPPTRPSRSRRKKLVQSEALLAMETKAGPAAAACTTSTRSPTPIATTTTSIEPGRGPNASRSSPTTGRSPRPKREIPLAPGRGRPRGRDARSRRSCGTPRAPPPCTCAKPQRAGERALHGCDRTRTCARSDKRALADLLHSNVIAIGETVPTRRARSRTVRRPNHSRS